MNKVDVNQARALSDNMTEKILVIVPFTENEVLALKDELSNKMLNLSRDEDDFKTIAGEWKSKIKKQKEFISEVLNKIKNLSEVVEKSCYLMPDLDAQVMNYVDITTGEIHKSRRLLPNENQTNLTSHLYLREVENG